MYVCTYSTFLALLYQDYCKEFFSFRFLSDYRDLMAWINSMMALVSSDELANDVTGAEALLERHQVNIL